MFQISNLITTVGEVKASNLKLSKSLEEAMDRYEMLASQNTDLQNTAESNMVSHWSFIGLYGEQYLILVYLEYDIDILYKSKPTNNHQHKFGVRLYVCISASVYSTSTHQDVHYVIRMSVMI